MESDGCVDNSTAFPIYIPNIPPTSLINDGNSRKLVLNNEILTTTNDHIINEEFHNEFQEISTDPEVQSIDIMRISNENLKTSMQDAQIFADITNSVKPVLFSLSDDPVQDTAPVVHNFSGDTDYAEFIDGDDATSMTLTNQLAAADWSNDNAISDQPVGLVLSSEQNHTEPILQDLLTHSNGQLTHCISQPKMLYSDEPVATSSPIVVELKQPKLEPSVLQLHQLGQQNTLPSPNGITSPTNAITLNTSCSQINSIDNSPSQALNIPASILDESQTPESNLTHQASQLTINREVLLTSPLQREPQPLTASHLTSSVANIELKIDVQPETQHRARYMTEGSRGTVKDVSQDGFPMVKMYGFHEEASLLVFIGSDCGRILPHKFYQVTRVQVKNGFESCEKIQDGIPIIEFKLRPENNMTAIIDCVGILKLRNSDVSQGLKQKKSTSARLVFRCDIKLPDGSYRTLQTASTPISCTQPTGHPEIHKKSIASAQMQGKQELFILGKNFIKPITVIFRQRVGTDEDGGGTIDVTNDEFDDDKSFNWTQQAKIDMDLYHLAHIVCEVPEYTGPSESASSVPVEFIVKAKDKISEPAAFVYLANVDIIEDDVCESQNLDAWPIRDIMNIKEEPVPMEIDQPNFKRQASDIEYPSPVDEVAVISGNLKFEPNDVTTIESNPLTTDNLPNANSSQTSSISSNQSPIDHSSPLEPERKRVSTSTHHSPATSVVSRPEDLDQISVLDLSDTARRPSIVSPTVTLEGMIKVQQDLIQRQQDQMAIQEQTINQQNLDRHRQDIMLAEQQQKIRQQKYDKHVQQLTIEKHKYDRLIQEKLLIEKDHKIAQQKEEKMMQQATIEQQNHDKLMQQHILVEQERQIQQHKTSDLNEIFADTVEPIIEQDTTRRPIQTGQLTVQCTPSTIGNSDFNYDTPPNSSLTSSHQSSPQTMPNNIVTSTPLSPTSINSILPDNCNSLMSESLNELQNLISETSSKDIRLETKVINESTQMDEQYLLNKDSSQVDLKTLECTEDGNITTHEHLIHEQIDHTTKDYPDNNEQLFIQTSQNTSIDQVASLQQAPLQCVIQESNTLLSSTIVEDSAQVNTTPALISTPTFTAPASPSMVPMPTGIANKLKKGLPLTFDEQASLQKLTVGLPFNAANHSSQINEENFNPIPAETILQEANKSDTEIFLSTDEVYSLLASLTDNDLDQSSHQT